MVVVSLSLSPLATEEKIRDYNNNRYGTGKLKDGYISPLSSLDM